ncbi:CDP-glycerol glycerophosphotransferase family protein [Microbacterium sp. TNHR37B]|uniref:CDP-glycerol glycerophosphotransferase family protein n=1 Tax=Microbacterium sp. TNHR37B TaxID=1775956 RepID=UPI0007B186B4|nr:CDP-glycerol glycerophosphotransferase family protein [Microbacterium sp. TNHR37B]KZE91237.1 putative CDP-glycerol:glycerophosphate glycerophosphotransferase [Microbacterium sp. TNHR37B]
MASFSFGAGNVAKLVRIPLYVFGRLATMIVPRSSREWVFGSAVGIADGALALWRVAAAAGEQTVWLVADDEQARAAATAGIPAVRKGSARAFWRTARARVVVVTHGFGDVDRYATTGAVVVQLWHGIPLKRIGLDSPATVRAPLVILRPLIAALYRRTQRQIRLIPAASHLVRGRLESAFALPDPSVPVTGEPRVDVLSTGSAAERHDAARAEIERVVGPVDGRALVLYAPTWRDGAPDPAVPDAAQWQRIVEVLEERDAVLLIRSHPLGAGDYAAGVGDRIRLLGSDLVADVTPLLPALRALVTDYSSLIFDASLVPVPAVFLAPDLESYEAERGFYGRYADVSGGEHARDWAQAADQLAAVLADGAERDRRLERARALDARVHAFRDGRNTERVYVRIRDILEGQRR